MEPRTTNLSLKVLTPTHLLSQAMLKSLKHKRESGKKKVKRKEEAKPISAERKLAKESEQEEKVVFESDTEKESASELSKEDNERLFNDESEEEDTTHFKTMVVKACLSFPPITEQQAFVYLKSVWERICYYPEVIG